MIVKLLFQNNQVCTITEKQMEKFASRMLAKKKTLEICELDYDFETIFGINNNVTKLNFKSKNKFTMFIHQIL